MAKAKRKPWNKGKKLHNWGDVHSHRRRLNPKRKHKRRRTRSNPAPATVLLANPHRRHRRKHHRRHYARLNPIRRHHRSRAVGAIMRRRRIHRRRNPIHVTAGMRSIGGFLRLAAFGAAGVLFVRIVGNAYSKYVAQHVIGDETDEKGWRHIANEALRLAAMGAATYVMDRAARRALRPEDRMAFVYAAAGETGRQAVGVIVKRLSPSTNRATYGLDAPNVGTTWVLRNGRYVPVSQQLQGLEDISSFQGLEDISSFQGVPRY